MSIVKNEYFQIKSNKSIHLNGSSGPHNINILKKETKFKPQQKIIWREKSEPQKTITLKPSIPHIDNENNSLALIVEKLDRIMAILIKEDR